MDANLSLLMSAGGCIIGMVGIYFALDHEAVKKIEDYIQRSLHVGDAVAGEENAESLPVLSDGQRLSPLLNAWWTCRKRDLCETALNRVFSFLLINVTLLIFLVATEEISSASEFVEIVSVGVFVILVVLALYLFQVRTEIQELQTTFEDEQLTLDA